MKYLLTLMMACGLLPLPPLPPLGCKELEPVCICDENADNCEWSYICKDS